MNVQAKGVMHTPSGSEEEVACRQEARGPWKGLTKKPYAHGLVLNRWHAAIACFLFWVRRHCDFLH